MHSYPDTPPRRNDEMAFGKKKKTKAPEGGVIHPADVVPKQPLWYWASKYVQGQEPSGQPAHVGTCVRHAAGPSSALIPLIYYAGGSWPLQS